MSIANRWLRVNCSSENFSLRESQFYVECHSRVLSMRTSEKFYCQGHLNSPCNIPSQHCTSGCHIVNCQIEINSLNVFQFCLFKMFIKV